MSRCVDIATLKGQVLLGAIVNDQENVVTLITEKFHYTFFHEQDCCERVVLVDVIGDHKELHDKRITKTDCIEINEESRRPSWVSWLMLNRHEDSTNTWTEHLIEVEDGSKLILRWFGSSNGYYGEQVDIEELERNPQPEPKPVNETKTHEWMKLEPLPDSSDVSSTGSVNLIEIMRNDAALYADWKTKQLNKDWRQE